MHHPTDRIAHTTAFVTPVVEHWLERVTLLEVGEKEQSAIVKKHTQEPQCFKCSGWKLVTLLEGSQREQGVIIKLIALDGSRLTTSNPVRG